MADLGLDATKDRIKNKIDEKKLRESLATYILSQQKYNEISSLAEEIDFQGLIDYIKNNLIEAVATRIFDPNRKKRGQTRQQIVDAAVAFSKAKTFEAKGKVSKCISICLDIIRGFYEEHHLSLKEFLLADMIVDAVADEVVEAQTTVMEAVDSAKNEILAKIQNTGSLFSIDKALAFAKAGETDTIRDGIKKMLDHISLEHPYYPQYGYDYGIVGSIKVASCWLQKKVGDNWTYYCWLPAPTEESNNTIGYGSSMDYSSYIPSDGNTYRVAGRFVADGHHATRYSNQRSF